MKFQMAKNSLFAILLRSPWWVSALIGVLIGLVSFALLPVRFRVVGALSGLPFFAIGVVAAGRQWQLPSAARVALTQRVVAGLAWPAFSVLLERAFQREGYTVRRVEGDACDFELERQGRRTVVSARRWKSARPGVEVLRALQKAREARGVEDALYIGLAPLSENALPYATEHGITLWQVHELAQALKAEPLPP